MTNVSTYARSLNQITLLKQQQTELSDLSTQLATGKKTQKFTGLGNDVMVSQRSRAGISSSDKYLQNIINSERRINMMLSNIEEFQSQAENFSKALVGLSQETVHQKGDIIKWDDPLTELTEEVQVGLTRADGDAEAKALQELAGSMFDILYNVLNSKDGDRYIFGGSETLTPPIGDTSSLDAAITTAITNWKNEGSPGNISTDDLISNLRDRNSATNADAITDTIIGYNAELSSGNVGKIFARINDTSEVDHTLLANEEGLRNIMVTLSYFKNEKLWPVADVYNEPYTDGDPLATDPDTGQPLRGAPGDTIEAMKENFYEVFNELTQMFNEAIDDIDQMRFQLENARVQLKEAKSAHTQRKALLENVVSDVEDIDINQVAVRINMLEIQLDASYRVTARVQELSLVNFI